MKKFKIIFFAAIWLAVLTVCSCAGKHSTDERPDYVVSLDSILRLAPEFEARKLIYIDELRQKLNRSENIDDKYTYSKLLFNEYLAYQSDSAMKYADQCVALAYKTADSDKIAQSLINKAHVLTGEGMLDDGRKILESIDSRKLSDDLRLDYYAKMRSLYSHLGNYDGRENNDYYIKEREYRDSINAVISPDEPEYLWYKALDVLGTDKPADVIISHLKKALDNSEFGSTIDSRNAYALAKLYQQTGDYENYKRYMAIAAKIDVENCNRRELSALEEFAWIMRDEGNIEHAFNYIDYCLARTMEYPNRVKAVSMTKALESINKAYQQRNSEQLESIDRQIVWLVILAAVLAAVAGLCLFLYYRVRKQKHQLDKTNASLHDNIVGLKESQSKLNAAYSQLKNLNDELQEKNDELSEANYVKEEYVMSAFSICSDYIQQIAALKKNVHVNLINKKYDKIGELTEDFDMRDELKEFYRLFDTVFLHIYPNFVEDFNSLLQEDKKIYPKEGELLNTELRIYALVRLGISDSSQIAEFLHYSPQTVYNNRFRVRNKANMSKEEFAERVRKLGKAVKE